MSGRLITVFGGSGFLGRYVVQRLAARGDRVRAAVRRPNDALFLKTAGDVGQVQIVSANLNDHRSIERAVKGADGVINLVGVLQSSGSQSFQKLQAEGAGYVADKAAEAGAKTMVHVSAIGANPLSTSEYAVTKAEGERLVEECFSGATIIRPSLIIGHEDGFFNKFAKLAKFMPVLPVPATKTNFQPVFVGDVADAIVKAVDGGDAVVGKVFELGGPEVMSFKAMLDMMMQHIGMNRPIFDLPMPIASMQASLMSLLPNPPMTNDQLELLKTDNVVSDGALTFADLGIEPEAIEGILPAYTVQYRPKGQFT